MKTVPSLFFTFSLAAAALGAQAQVGVGTPTPDAKSALDIRATDKGLLIPRLTASQRMGITSPPQGLIVYQTDGTASGGAQTGFWYYAGTGGWVYLDPATGGGALTLPYSGTASTTGSVFQITNSGAGSGLRGASASGQGVVGRVNGTGAGQGVVGVKGTTVPNIEDAGVVGLSDADYGVYARSSQSSGVVGVSDGTAASLAGVAGSSSATNGVGVSGSAPGTGVLGTGTTGAGVDGTSSANANTTGGVVGRNSGGSNAVGVLGLTTNGYGVRGVASASGGYGVQGVATDSYALIGTSSSGVGAQGTSTSNTGVRGNSNSSYGVYGGSSSGSGVYGTTAVGNTGGVAGVEGNSSNSSGVGVLGTTSSGYGVRGEATGSSGYGVTGVASAANGIGVLGSATGAATGVFGQASGTGRAGYFNQSSASSPANAVEINQNGSGVGLLVGNANGTDAAALQLVNTATAVLSGPNIANSSKLTTALKFVGAASDAPNAAWYLTGRSSYPGTGPGSGTQFGVAFSDQNNSIRNFLSIEPSYSGTSTSNCYAAITGSLGVSGGISASFATAQVKNFKIDHPLDPANKYLYHTSVESPDMLDLYSGNVVLDAKGRGQVVLPDWFEALNRDFRYQLTSIGQAAPGLYIASPLQHNAFGIAGGAPGSTVSWQVTAVRHDAFANAHRSPVEVAKEPQNQGRYLAPEAFGQPAEQGILHSTTPASVPAAATTAAR
ncbi:hypothetical protein Q5H92_26280 [Hymenobacter sp. M29]|uniref:Peptidase S74 domain-containing protein n=1 Tax=Hymenobacter mellowenesis TaxID=3063995 RepID=A0ABT9AJ53_9BACT|nr:hypothetical protein [Hymenobacter sp. M29]MDO7849895.1 hypothetical protein [Hymenobacter sp. M29]